jgi:hypothetical protein
MKSLPKAHEPELREWRRARLIQAGFTPELATRLGWDGRIDVHDLLELVDRGCPPELAARIAAPLDA